MKSLYDHRRDNLRHLIGTRFGGSQTKLAKAVGLNQPSFVSRLLTDREGTRKNIGNELARKIERGLGLSSNVLDTADLAAMQTESDSVPSSKAASRGVGLGGLLALERETLAEVEGGAEHVVLLDTDELGQFDRIASVYEVPPEAAKRISTHAGPPPPDVVALWLPDDSMGERFPKGSIVVVAERTPVANDFVVGVVPVTYRACMRQWVEGAGRSFLVPLNRDYQATEMTPEITLLGVVVEAMLFF